MVTLRMSFELIDLSSIPGIGRRRKKPDVVSRTVVGKTGPNPTSGRTNQHQQVDDEEEGNHGDGGKRQLCVTLPESPSVRETISKRSAREKVRPCL